MTDALSPARRLRESQAVYLTDAERVLARIEELLRERGAFDAPPETP